jgi:hypothetical protein
LKKPAAGWFRYVPLYPASSLDSVLSTAALKNYFGITDNDLVPDDKNGNRYFSVYSAFVYVPDQRYYYHHNFQDYIDLVSTVYGGPKLYRNPFRSIPYFLSYNMTGSKEFVLMAYARGKYFKEPRVFISVFSSPYTYVWDKTPPHIAWDPSISSISGTYAPMYYVNPRNPAEKTSTDLSKTVIPYVFDVDLSGNSLFMSRECSVRDVGFGRITSVRLCFNYASDFLSMEPVTGRRHYSKATIAVAELSAQDLAGQINTSYQVGKASSGLGDVSFKGLDARLWQKGIWDMWLETSDDLGNSGVAPVMTPNSSYSDKLGLASVRQIEIK